MHQLQCNPRNKRQYGLGVTVAGNFEADEVIFLEVRHPKSIYHPKFKTKITEHHLKLKPNLHLETNFENINYLVDNLLNIVLDEISQDDKFK